MKIEKLSLKGIKNALSRNEMKKIMAGSGPCIPPGGACGALVNNFCCLNFICETNQLGIGICIHP